MRLAEVLREYRWALRIGVRDMAKEIGISSATLSRIENGNNCDAKSLTKIMVWLFSSPTTKGPAR